MTKIITLLTLFISISLYANEIDEIITVPLNPKLVHTLPITEMDKGTTTIKFPSAITAVFPSQVGVDTSSGSANQKNPYPFVLKVPSENSHFFQIKCLAKEGAKGQINVIHNDEIYIIKLKAVPQGVSAVTFKSAPNPNLVKKANVTPNLLISAIKKSQRFNEFKAYYPESVRGIGHEKINKTYSFKYHDITLVEGFRYSNLDTIVFRCQIKNKTEYELKFNPSDVVANLKEFFFHSQVTDASGTVPPKATTEVYFSINGTHENKPLAINNPWIIIIPINEKEVDILTGNYAKQKAAFEKKQKEQIKEEPKPEKVIRTIRRIKIKEAEDK